MWPSLADSHQRRISAVAIAASSAIGCGMSALQWRATCAAASAERPCHALQLVRVILLHFLDPLVRAKKSVLRHVGRILARRRPFADGLGERADVMRPRAAAHTQVADVELRGLTAELGDLEPVAREGV